MKLKLEPGDPLITLKVEGPVTGQDLAVLRAGVTKLLKDTKNRKPLLVQFISAPPQEKELGEFKNYFDESAALENRDILWGMPEQQPDQVWKAWNEVSRLVRIQETEKKLKSRFERLKKEKDELEKKFNQMASGPNDPRTKLKEKSQTRRLVNVLEGWIKEQAPLRKDEPASDSSAEKKLELVRSVIHNVLSSQGVVPGGK